MATSNKTLIISTLLTGTAVATGTLLYGVMERQPTKLVILDDTLPPVLNNGLLPPPSTYRMSTPPPVDIPGIRRLQIARPSLSNDGGDGDSDADFYLTGTRSAELIRAPVEARIETFPTVTLDEAVEGALAVDEWGFQVVQSYLNQAMGDSEILKERMDALLARIEAAAGDYDLATISDAANLIIEAGARTHWTAFMAPFVLDPSFELTDDAIGWDLGPKEDKPYTDFIRVSSDSKMLTGENMQSEASQGGPSIMSKGVRNIEQFVANGLPNGRYRVVILTAPRPNGQTPLYPFGVDLKRNGAKVNMVDARATDDLVPVMKLSRDGVGRLSDGGSIDPSEITLNDNEPTYSLHAAANGGLVSSTEGIDAVVTQASYEALTSSASSLVPDVAPFAQAFGGGNAPSSTGHILVTRAEVVDGTLRINFRQLGGQDTYVTAVIVYPEPADDIEQQLAEEVAQFINRVAPAAGENIAADVIQSLNVPIVDPVTVFADNSGGLPTPEAVSATPVVDVVTSDPDDGPVVTGTPAPTSAPTPEPSAEPTAAPTPEEPDRLGAPNETPAPSPEPTSPPDTAAPTSAPTSPPDTAEPTSAPTSPPDTAEPTSAPTSPPDTAEPTSAPTSPPDTAEPTSAPTSPPDTAAPTSAPTSPPDTAAPTSAPPTSVEPTPAPTSPPTSATPEPAPTLAAEAGIYEPQPLGSDFTLDGCASEFQDQLFCQLVDTGAFELSWILLGPDGNNVVLGTGDRLLVQSGENTLLTEARTNYNVQLTVRYDGNLGNDRFVNFVTGGNLFLPGDFILTSVDTAVLRLTTVPEPSSLLLLAPGLVYVARRQSKKKKKTKSSA